MTEPTPTQAPQIQIPAKLIDFGRVGGRKKYLGRGMWMLLGFDERRRRDAGREERA